MHIVIGSTSHRKIQITEKTSRRLFSGEVIVTGFAAASGVPDTPYDRQTFEGSRNRALDARNHFEIADLCLGLETGLVARYGQIYEEAWATAIDLQGKEFFGYSSGLKVPDYILQRMEECRMEHCDLMTVIEDECGKLQNDSWSTYSGGMLLREVSLEEALRNALIQIIAPDLGFYRR